MRILASACAFAYEGRQDMWPHVDQRDVPNYYRPGAWQSNDHWYINAAVATPCISQQFRAGLTPYVVEATPLLPRDLDVLSTADTFRFVTRIEFSDVDEHLPDYAKLSFHTVDTVIATLNKLEFARDVTVPEDLNFFGNDDEFVHTEENETERRQRFATALAATMPHLTTLDPGPLVKFKDSVAILMTHPNAGVRASVTAALAKRCVFEHVMDHLLQRLDDDNLSVGELLQIVSKLRDRIFCIAWMFETSSYQHRDSPRASALVTKLTNMLGESDSAEVVRSILLFVRELMERLWRSTSYELRSNIFVDGGFIDTCVDLLGGVAGITDLNRVTARDAAVLDVAPVLDTFCSLRNLPRGCAAKLVKDGLVDAVVSLHRNQPLRAALQAAAAGPDYSQATNINFQLLQCLAASLAPERVVEIGIDQRAAAIAVHRYEQNRHAKLTRVMHRREAQVNSDDDEMDEKMSNVLRTSNKDKAVRHDWADPQLLMNFLFAMSTLPIQPVDNNPEFELTDDEQDQLSEEQLEQREQELDALKQAARDRSNEQVRRIFGTLSRDSLQLLSPLTALLHSVLDATEQYDYHELDGRTAREPLKMALSLLYRIFKKLSVARSNEFLRFEEDADLCVNNKQRRRVRCEADAELLEERPGSILNSWVIESDIGELCDALRGCFLGYLPDDIGEGHFVYH